MIVLRVEPPVPRKVVIPLHRAPGGFQFQSQTFKPIDEYARVSPHSGSKIRHGTDVNLPPPTPKPAPTAGRERGRFGELFQPKHPRIETTGDVLTPGRAEDLDVVKALKHKSHARRLPCKPYVRLALLVPLEGDRNLVLATGR
ncbi:hypothetical protein SAMN05421748_11252 [Paractinoplanes atraurantiacus]|uniref:Uncharacterized protein n=1 Tax=Paractinoplanes atraurantiacus TaxID=1036182 RepID=A0A285IXL8_9ACTN|nr:hypothetical protein SAMN05421748_11252 [Actinoplanes atraurantiacus]